MAGEEEALKILQKNPDLPSNVDVQMEKKEMKHQKTDN